MSLLLLGPFRLKSNGLHPCKGTARTSERSQGDTFKDVNDAFQGDIFTDA